MAENSLHRGYSGRYNRKREHQSFPYESEEISSMMTNCMQAMELEEDGPLSYAEYEMIVSVKRRREDNDGQQRHPSGDEIQVKEDLLWLPNSSFPLSMIDINDNWIKVGPRLGIVDAQCSFCDRYLLHQLLDAKDSLKDIDYKLLYLARNETNPYELIKGTIFMNQAAMKIANIDAINDFMLTDPKDQSGKPMVGSSELLFFADICAGPGGFSEYIFWRKKWEAKGFGFTLKEKCDFILDNFRYGHSETFEPHYGVRGVAGNGNIYERNNMVAFRDFVLANTNKTGVHFAMADGGFSVEGKENEQEILHKHLYVCQLALGISIIRLGGHFVCKFYDIFTDFSVGLIYLINQVFHAVSIHKPNTSKPANSERYLICKWKKANMENIENYLFRLNDEIVKAKDSDMDVTECVPLSIILQDHCFKAFIENSNNTIGRNQLLAIEKIKTFNENTYLQPFDQISVRGRCLKLWEIPNTQRKWTETISPFTFICSIFLKEDITKLKQPIKILDEQALKRIDNPYNYHCVLTGSLENRCMFVLGIGKTNILTWINFSRWVPIDIVFELPPRTLLYAEIVPEIREHGKIQRKKLALHIIDALFLGGEDVRNLHYTERLNRAKKMADAVTKSTRPEYALVTVKNIFKISNVNSMFQNLELKKLKSIIKKRLCCHIDENKFYVVTGLFIFQTIKEPWTISLSKNRYRFYYYNKKTRESTFTCPNGSISDFLDCFENRLHWAWDLPFQLGENKSSSSTQLIKDKVVEHVSNIKKF